jgi:hypothetical protein
MSKTLRRTIHKVPFIASTLCWLLASAALSHAEPGAKAVKDLTVEESHPQSLALSQRPHKPVVVSLIPTGPSVLKVGMPIGFKLESSASGYAHLYVLDASGKSQGWLENIRIRSHHPMTYPLGGYVVRASPPSGDETILFIVSRKPIHGFASDAGTRIPFDTQVAAASFHDVLADKLKVLPARDWVMTETHLRVEDQ